MTKWCALGRHDTDQWPAWKSSYCQPCANAYQKARRSGSPMYRSYERRYAPNRRASDAARKASNKALVLAAAGSGCVDCGERDPVVIDFDHVRGEKVANISRLLGGSTARLKAELEKCEPRCANCHRRVTASRRANQVEKRPK